MIYEYVHTGEKRGIDYSIAVTKFHDYGKKRKY